MPLSKSHGFTLIELSIVLVIIGLIVGGVLVGRDMIRSAEIRATIGQIEKYNSAVNTFRSKYNCLPGDCQEAQAVQLGLFALTGGSPVGGAALGDGNGLIESGGGLTAPHGETILFFRHLSDANLIDGSFGSSMTTSGQLGSITAPPNQYLPPAKLGNANYIIVGSSSGVNYWGIIGLSILAPTYNYASYLTPIDAYNIDNKVDDGMPNTGIVQARGPQSGGSPLNDLAAANAAPSGSTATPGNCTLGTTATDPTDIYNVNTGSGGNVMACLLRLRWN